MGGFNTFFDQLFLFIVLPLGALFIVLAAKAGKGGAIVGIVVALLVGAALVFADQGTWNTIGDAMSSLIENIVNQVSGAAG